MNNYKYIKYMKEDGIELRSTTSKVKKEKNLLIWIQENTFALFQLTCLMKWLSIFFGR
jgi:hypothetical protein